MLSNFFFWAPKIVPFEIMWENIVERGTPQTTKWRMRIACWIRKATNTKAHTHTGCVIIIAFPPQQWLRERAEMLRYTDTACLPDTARLHQLITKFSTFYVTLTFVTVFTTAGHLCRPKLHPTSLRSTLTLWRRNYIFFFLISAHPVHKMWIIQDPTKLVLWNKLHFEEKKNGEYRACLKYSVPTFVE